MSSSHIQPSDASIASFAQRKAHTLSAVDLSPKGSIDTPILPLIELLNSHHLISTTSSCSGRISVFLDGELSTTGKGGGGRWVLISHEVVEVSDAVERVWKEMSFDADNEGKITGRRFLHFKFEPMLLHIQTADLSTAQRLLSIALSNGFRESGILNSTSFPMLAIRTQSLSFDCIIGVYESTTENIRPLVDRSYVTMLMEIGNERMRQNAEKMQRLQKEIESSLKDNDGNCARRKGKKGADWEDAELRKQRLREEGLRRKEEIRRERESREAESTEPVSNTDDEI